LKISFTAALASAAGDVQKRASALPAREVVSPAQFGGAGYSPGGGQTVQTDWDERKAIQEGYRSSTWPFACMDRLQGACSAVPWVVYERRGRKRKEWERQDGHHYEICIEYPMPGLLSRQSLVSGMVLSICCGGNSLSRVLYVKRDREEVPVELHPMSTALWRPVPVGDFDKPTMVKNREGQQVFTRWIRGYKRIDRNDPPIEPWRVVHAQKLDPGVWTWGMSPMRPIAPIIDMDRAMVAWNARLPNQNMVPAGAFVDPHLRTDHQMQERSRQLRARFQDPSLQGAPLVMGADTTWLPMGHTMVEADWDASRHSNRDEVCAAFNVSPTIFVSDAKYANAEQGRIMLYENGARDFLELLQDAFNNALVPDSRRRDLFIAYDLSDVPGVRDTLPARLEGHERAMRSGIPVNSSILLFDLDVAQVDGGDLPLVPATLTTLRSLTEEPAPPPVDDGTDDGSVPIPPGDPLAGKEPEPEEP
jgi:phage portal protein BeeE